MRLSEGEGTFAVDFLDNGVPLRPPVDAGARRDPPPGGTAEGGGLGILLVRRVMDEVHYRREGGRNVLRIVMNP